MPAECMCESPIPVERYRLPSPSPVHENDAWLCRPVTEAPLSVSVTRNANVHAGTDVVRVSADTRTVEDAAAAGDTVGPSAVNTKSAALTTHRTLDRRPTISTPRTPSRRTVKNSSEKLSIPAEIALIGQVGQDLVEELGLLLLVDRCTARGRAGRLHAADVLQGEVVTQQAVEPRVHKR